MLAAVEATVGAGVMALVLLDVFLTVLYARAGAAIISSQLGRLVWRAFRLISAHAGDARGWIMSFCGPVIVILLLATWSVGLAVGTGLVIHPSLGTSVRSTTGTTPTDFLTALFAGGSSISIVRSGDFAPYSNTFRIFFFFASLVGTSVLSLTLTYLMQIYNALQTRNSLALEFHLACAETADAAQLIMAVGPEGRFGGGYSQLATLATSVAGARESHHFYPVLFYFRFPEPFYAVSRFTLLGLDAAALIDSALDEAQFGWLKESAAVSQLSRGSTLVLQTLVETFLQGRAQNPTRIDAKTADRWTRRYVAAVRRLQEAGLRTVADERAGADRYVLLRTAWDSYIQALAPAMHFRLEEIDPVGCNPPPPEQPAPAQSDEESAAARANPSPSPDV